MKTISSTGNQNGVPAHCSTRRKISLRFAALIMRRMMSPASLKRAEVRKIFCNQKFFFGRCVIAAVLLILALGSVPALADEAPLFQPMVHYNSMQIGPSNVTTGDFNNDGKLDLAVKEQHNFSILSGCGDGTFLRTETYEISASIDSIAVGDIDGNISSDGIQDMVVANSPNKLCRAVPINGTLVLVDICTIGNNPRSLIIDDFNSDGKLDLVVASSSSGTGTVSILIGNGDLTFNEAVNYSFEGSPTSITVDDFNSDGHHDLAVVNFNCITILMGCDDGTFGAAVNYAAGNYPKSIAVGDFNGDSKQDLAVANYSFNPGDDYVSILLGNGNGTFDTEGRYVSGIGESDPCSVAVGDFNCDGRLDLAVANQGHDYSGYDYISILLGQGDGTFTAPMNLEMGTNTNPCSIVAADFNGDGLPDLAVTKAQDHSFTVLLHSAEQLTLKLAGTISELTAGGDEYDLNNLSLSWQNQWGYTSDTAVLPVTWTCSGTTCSIRDGHYLKPLSPGSGVTVTATINGVTSNPLSFDVLPAVNNADLSSLAVTPGSISGFSPDTVAYAVIASSTPASLTVTATADDSRSSLTIGGRPAMNGIPQTVKLDNGANLIPVIVTAADGQTQKAYVLSVNGTVNDAELESLSVSTGSLSFDPSVVTYDLGSVASSDSGLDITVSPHDPKALVLLNGSPVQAGVPKTVNLTYGENYIEVMVVAQDATIKAYTISVTRDRPSIAWNAGSLQAADISATGLTLTWPAASCDAGISGYNIYQGASLLSTVADSVYSYNVADLTQGTTYDFSVRAVDAAGSLSSPLTLSAGTISELRITTAMLTGATVGRSYSAALEAGGGNAPYAWSATGLPAGLALDSAGTITGTPIVPGTSVVNVTLTDSNGLSTSKGFALSVFYPAGTGKYTITPVSIPEYTTGTTAQGITTLTVNNGVTGFKCFEVNVSTVESHTGNETVVFVQVRDGAQVAINAAKADFDQVNSAIAAFNVKPGDVIKVYVVDNLTNDTISNPALLQ